MVPLDAIDQVADALLLRGSRHGWIGFSCRQKALLANLFLAEPRDLLRQACQTFTRALTRYGVNRKSATISDPDYPQVEKRKHVGGPCMPLRAHSRSYMVDFPKAVRLDVAGISTSTSFCSRKHD